MILRISVVALALCATALLTGCDETLTSLADADATIEALETEVAGLRTVVATAADPIVLAAAETFECFREGGDARPIEIEYVLAGEVRSFCVAASGDCALAVGVGEPLPAACRTTLPE